MRIFACFGAVEEVAHEDEAVLLSSMAMTK
jgi:hypothetical protein